MKVIPKWCSEASEADPHFWNIVATAVVVSIMMAVWLVMIVRLALDAPGQDARQSGVDESLLPHAQTLAPRLIESNVSACRVDDRRRVCILAVTTSQGIQNSWKGDRCAGFEGHMIRITLQSDNTVTLDTSIRKGRLSKQNAEQLISAGVALCVSAVSEYATNIASWE